MPSQITSGDRSPIIFLVFALIGSAAGYFYSILMSGVPIIGIVTGAVMAGSIALFELYYVRHPRGRWLRRLPLIGFIAITLVVWVFIMTLSLQGIPNLFAIPEDGRYAGGNFSKPFWADLTFSIVVALIMTTAMRLRSLIGGRVLFNFLSGQYRHPVDEQRIFFFLDLCDSTKIAEQLGTVGYHSFLRDFIETVERPVVEHGGEVYQYVGDEVVATWPVLSPDSNNRVIDCHFAMLDAIEVRRPYFQSNYQFVPEFRSGIHCGDVVAGEIGDHRRQIVFVGDVVNTAARIEGQARQLNRGLLVSDTLLHQTNLQPPFCAESIGKTQLKGKADSIELFEILNGQPAG